jgi:hypothetical protein
MPQSWYFGSVCYGDLLESNTLQIDLSKEDPETLTIIFYYLYTGILCANPEPSLLNGDTEQQPSLKTRIQVYQLATHLMIEELQTLAEKTIPKEKLGNSATCDGVVDVLLKLYEATQEGDSPMSLRGAVNRICFYHYVELGFIDEGVLPIGLTHEPEHWAMIKVFAALPALRMVGEEVLHELAR